MYEIKEKVEIPEGGWSERIMNNVTWGDSAFNPNKKERDEEVLLEAKRLVSERD